MTITRGLGWEWPSWFTVRQGKNLLSVAMVTGVVWKGEVYVLDGMEQNQFEAVLAHELGHVFGNKE